MPPEEAVSAEGKGAVGGRREQRRRPVQPLPFSWTLGGGTPGVQASARSGKTCRAESDAVCGQRSGFGLGDRPVSGTVHSITPYHSVTPP